MYVNHENPRKQRKSLRAIGIGMIHETVDGDQYNKGYV